MNTHAMPARCVRLAGAAMLLILSAAAPALADDLVDKGPYLPTPVAQRPTEADEVAMRRQQEHDQLDTLASEGLSNAEREAHDMAALGFSPDDPIALAAYRAESQNNPNAITAAGDFILNTTWGAGGLSADRYASSNSGAYRGIKAAMLSNGETIVLGSVKINTSSPLSFGLTKRAANGSRVAWTGVDPQYGHYSKQYVLYPNTNTSVPPVYSIHDIKVRSDKIYVLYTGHLTSINTYGPVVVCFKADGSGCGWWYAGYENQPTSDAVAMDIYGDRFVVLGRHSLGTSGGFWTWTGSINSGGGLEDSVLTDFPAPGGYDRSNPADVAFRRVGSTPPIVTGGLPYYVLFTKKFSAASSSSDYDPCLLAVKSNNAPDATFDTNGVRCMPFDETDSSNEDQAVALTTNGWGLLTYAHEGVQVLVSVARSVDPGIGIWELLDRANHPRFGATTGAAGAHGRGNGRAVYGGCGTRNGSNQGEGCQFVATSARHAGRDLANVGSDVVVAGSRYGNGIVVGSSRYYSSLIARVHGDSGELEQFTTFPSGYSEGWFNSLVARNAQDVIGIGAAIDSAVSNPTARTQIMTGLTSNDTIFDNGFD